MRLKRSNINNLATMFLAAVSLLVPALLGWSERCPVGRETYLYDYPSVKLHGRLLEKDVLGPPGYGESPQVDRKGKIFVLRLDCAIDVVPHAGSVPKHTSSLDAIHDVKEVQLFFRLKDDAKAAQSHLNMSVTVHGDLGEATAPGEYEKVSMDVSRISF